MLPFDHRLTGDPGHGRSRMTRRLLLLLVACLLACTCVSGQKKVSVTEVSVDSAVEDIQWGGADHSVVFLKTTKGRLYRSTDSGKQWNDITNSLVLSETEPGAPATAITVDSMLLNPVDKNIVLVVGTKHSHFISNDAGRTWRRLKQRVPIHSWQFHPTQPHWALLSAWSDQCHTASEPAKTAAGGAATDKACNHMLYVTKDLGVQFHLVSSYVVQFSWGDVKHNQQNWIYFTHHRTKEGGQPKYGGWTKNVDFAVTEDFGRSHRVLMHHGNKFLVSNGYTFVAKSEDEAKQTVALMVSTDGGKTFEKAKLPFELSEKSYTVLDTSEGAVMLHVNHGDEGRSGSGNVYISDHKGLRYSLSLPSNVRTTTGETEFDRVLSLEGVYLANFKDDPEAEGALSAAAVEKKTEDKAAEQQEEEVSQTAVDSRHKPKRRSKAEDVVKTVISFDKGAVWSYLRAPKIDSTGNKIECPPDRCWLHLHGVTNFHNYAPFYSVENSVGIIMGTGNVGPHLRYEADEVNTY
ncbi:unnamed protein product, partial [Vitrella brassicaformis CCMP3155]